MGRAGHDIPLGVKLRPPPPREQWLGRDRLLGILAAARARLVLVAAPTGFGKTILAAQWLARQAGTHHCAWVSLDRGDNDPVRLWWHVVCALKQACPDLGDTDKLRPPSSPALDLAGQVIPALVRQLAALITPVVLVLDDYHLIRNPGCHEQIAFLLAHLPPSVQVVLIARADPPLPLAGPRAAGEMAEIRARELRFTPADTAALVRASTGVTLTHGDAATLTGWADGWPAAICLAAMTLRGNASPAAFIGQLARSNRHAADVLAEEFLIRQEPEVRWFLRRTSVLEHFTAPLCDVVAQMTGSVRIIADLARDNPFLMPLDDERRWYAYHPLFASLLRSRLAVAEPGVAAALHRRASRWHAGRGSARTAINHAIAAGDTEAVVDLIARFWRVFARVGRIATVRAWLGSLGDERIAADPVAAHCAAWAAAVSGDLASARRWLRSIDTARFEGPLPDGMRSLGFSAAMLRAAYGFDGLRVMRRSAVTAAKLDDDPRSPWYAPARAALGVSLYLSGDAVAAATALDEAIASETDPPTRVIALAVAALVALERDRFPQAHEFARAAGQVMDTAGLADSPPGALAWAAIAAVHSTQGRLAEAQAEFEHALASRRLSPDISPWPTVVILLGFAALLLDLGDPDAAHGLLAEATMVTTALPGGAEALRPRLNRLDRRLRGLSSGIFRR